MLLCRCDVLPQCCSRHALQVCVHRPLPMPRIGAPSGCPTRYPPCAALLRPCCPPLSLPAAAAARFFRQMVEVVRHAHALGICHRDIKPVRGCLIPAGGSVGTIGMVLRRTVARAWLGVVQTARQCQNRRPDRLPFGMQQRNNLTAHLPLLRLPPVPCLCPAACRRTSCCLTAARRRGSRPATLGCPSSSRQTESSTPSWAPPFT